MSLSNLVILFLVLQLSLMLIWQSLAFSKSCLLVSGFVLNVIVKLDDTVSCVIINVFVSMIVSASVTGSVVMMIVVCNGVSRIVVDVIVNTSVHIVDLTIGIVAVVDTNLVVVIVEVNIIG